MSTLDLPYRNQRRGVVSAIATCATVALFVLWIAMSTEVSEPSRVRIVDLQGTTIFAVTTVPVTGGGG